MFFFLIFKYMTENEITYRIRGCIFSVYNEMGPGALESMYEAALYHELRKAGLNVRKQVELPFIYRGEDTGIVYRLDLIVEEKVIVEIKSVATLLPVHHKQLITYLKLTGLKLGILVNFDEDNIRRGIFRKVLGLKESPADFANSADE